MKAVKLKRTEDGMLNLLCGNKWVSVSPHFCFPWSHPESFISLRNEKGDELALVEKFSDLDEKSRKELEKAVLETRFSFEIREVIAIEEEFQLRIWTVRTHQGRRVFQTALETWPDKLPSGEVFVRDLHGDCYRANFERLDKKSRQWLAPLVN